MRKNGWTKSEDRVLRERYPKGGWPAVQRYLPGRTIGAVRSRLGFLGVARHWGEFKNPAVSKPPPDVVHEVKTRACLRCQKAFDSAWAGERTCQTCKRAPTYAHGMSEPVSLGRRVFARGAGID